MTGAISVPGALVVDCLIRRDGPAEDGLGSAAMRVGTIVGCCAIVWAYTRWREAEIQRPFLVATLLIWTILLLGALEAASTGGISSPHSVGVLPVIILWAVLLPGGARYAALPMIGGFFIYAITVTLATPGHPSSTHQRLVFVYQLLSVSAFVGASEMVEGWRRRSSMESMVDWLTGLMSRRHLYQRIEALSAQLDRHPEPVAVVMFDVDHFKGINDAYGHRAGDEVLRMVAKAARSLTRAGDLCGRYGGDEFTIALADCDEAHAIQVIERLREQVAQTPVISRGAKVTVTLSAGVVCVPAGKRFDAQKILDSADAALYESKRAGRNRISVLPLAG
jgi:diguanylate cyclase (GGDEF)-like protein